MEPFRQAFLRVVQIHASHFGQSEPCREPQALRVTLEREVQVATQPGRAAHVRRLAMQAGLQAGAGRVNGAGEHPARPQCRHLRVQVRQPRQPAAQHDDIGVEQVDDVGQRARQTLRTAVQPGAAGDVAGGSRSGDGLAVQRLAGDVSVVLRQAAAAAQALDAAALPAAAREGRVEDRKFKHPLSRFCPPR